MPAREYTGGCHCGAVRYAVTLTLTDPPRATRCNCSICEKTGWTGVFVPAPDTDFRLLQPAAESELLDYQWRSKDIHRFACKKCAVYVFNHGRYEVAGTPHSFFSINAHSLDQPQEGLDLSTFVIEYFDGKGDNQGAGTQAAPQPGGML